jgi:hypothetical protein
MLDVKDTLGLSVKQHFLRHLRNRLGASSK